MIAYVKGELIKKTLNSVILNVNGIGYEVFVPTSYLNNLSPNFKELELFTYLHVREDILQLYGFLSWEEKECFLLLINVSGIGPKGALAILSNVSLVKLQTAIGTGDIQFLIKLPGVGKKTAQRLVIELKEKMQVFLPETSEINSELSGEHDLITALNGLGYQTSEIRKIYPRLLKENPDADEATLLKKALQLLAKY